MRFPHLVAHVRAFAGLAAIAATAQATPPVTAPEPEPTYYVCQVTRTSAFGPVSYSMEVPVDGSAPFHRAQWQIPQRAEGLTLSVQWDGWAPVDGRLDGAWFTIYFATSRPATRDARIEIGRMAGEGSTAEMVYAGPYQHPQPWGNHGLHALETQGRWGDLNAWIGGRAFLTFVLVRRDGWVVAEDRLDAALIAGMSGEVAAARRDVEAKAADYRHQCEVPQQIIIT